MSFGKSSVASRFYLTNRHCERTCCLWTPRGRGTWAMTQPRKVQPRSLERRSSTQTAPPPQHSASLTDDECTRLIALLEIKLSTIYISPEVGKMMAVALHENVANGNYKSIASPQLLAETLTADLYRVSQDRHVFVSFKEAPPKLTRCPPAKSATGPSRLMKRH